MNKNTPDRTLAGILAAGLASFLGVLLFPRGLKHFFKHGFAGLVRTIVVVALGGLLTQKFADILTRHVKSSQRPSE